MSLLLAGLVLASQAPAQSDVRMIAGRSVDLAPIHRWQKDEKGERPLPHWKRIRIISIGKPVGGLERCQVKIDNGETREILIKNLPPAIKQTFALEAKLARQVEEQNDYLANETERIRTMQANSSGRTVVVTHSGTHIYDAEVALANLKIGQEELRRLQEEHRQTQAETVAMRELAMFTGQKYAGLEVWDCGQKK